MANIRSNNTWYIDTAGNLGSNSTHQGMRVYYITVTATAANAVVVLQEKGQTANKLDLRVATSGESKLFDFSDKPVYFSGGVKASTVTNAIITLVFEEAGS